MKSRINRIARMLTLAAVTTSAATWSAASYACPYEPYLSAVCVMAWARNDLRGYAPAAGQQLAISTNQALFALLGTTYGGNGATTFALPDLRGRAVIGAGSGGPVGNYTVGQIGGTPTVTLLTNNLPIHNHPTLPVGMSTITAAVDLSKVTNTVDMTPVTYAANTSALAMKVSAVQGTATTPATSGASLASPLAPASKIYGTTAPDVTLAAGSVTGNVTVTASGVPTVTLGGAAPVTLSGTLPAGVTGNTGSSQAVNTMSPYLAMYYFIATQGIFPSSN